MTDKADVGGSPMLDGADFPSRLDAIAGRLSEHASREAPAGLTEPDPGAIERWEAAQAWAHMAEFVDYWREQAEAAIAAYDGQPVDFGRTKTDPARVAAIEMGRHAPVAELAGRAQASVAALRRYVAGLGAAEWAAVGRHPTLGDMDLESIVDRFMVGHLEEHLDQLDGLAARELP